MKGGDSGPRNWASGKHSKFQVVNVPPRTWTGGSSPRSAWLDVVCSDTSFHITLLKGQLSNVNVLGRYLDLSTYLKLSILLNACYQVVTIFPSPGFDHLLPVMDAPESCGYLVNPLKNTLTVPFTGCNVKPVS